jgi:hypothetical protein
LIAPSLASLFDDFEPIDIVVAKRAELLVEIDLAIFACVV